MPGIAFSLKPALKMANFASTRVSSNREVIAETRDDDAEIDGAMDEETGTPPAPTDLSMTLTPSSTAQAAFEVEKEEKKALKPKESFVENESVFRAYLRRTSAHGLSRIVKRSDGSRYVWIMLCVGIYGFTILVFGLMVNNYNDPDDLVIQLELEEVGELVGVRVMVSY